MPANFTALIVPVPEADALVRAAAAQFEPTSPLANQSSSVVAAHVTVLAPFLAPENINQRVIDDVQKICSTHRRHHFELGRIATFGAGVVYLRPEPSEALLRLSQSIWQRWPETPPYGGQYATVIPHVTLAIVGDAPEQITRLTQFAKPFLPLHADAWEVQLMLVHDGTWEVMHRFDLGTS
jgi:2'-5' RNA ligase